MKLGLSDELKNSHDEYPVKGRQGILIKQKLSFGEFATTTVKRSWTRGTSSKEGIGFGSNPYAADYDNIIGIEYINQKQTLSFGLSDGSRHSAVYCASRFNAEELTVGNNPNSVVNIVLDLLGKGGSSTNNFYVQVYASPTDKPWQLLLDNEASQASAKSYKGVFAKSREEYYTILPVTKLESKGQLRNMPFGSAGFEIQNRQGKPVAAVSMMNNGVVFLAKNSAEERFLIANLCAALLLQEQIG